MSAETTKAKEQIESVDNVSVPAQIAQMFPGEQYVLTAADYNLITWHIGQINKILERSRVCHNVHESAAGQNVGPVPAKLNDVVVNSLVGPDVVYYNFDTNAWNTNRYNDCTIKDQNADTNRVQNFKSVMEEVPEFSQQYEMVASVTMSIDRAFFLGHGKLVSNPQYNRTGTAVVGNIIVRNKKTGAYELYGKSWVGVLGYRYPGGAARFGAGRFAFYGVSQFFFRRALLTAHTR